MPYTPPGIPPGTFWPDAPPVSPHANDDEFGASTIGAAWTEWDPNNVVFPVADPIGMRMANTNTSGSVWGGLRRAVPSGDWAIVTKMSISGLTGVEQAAALLIAGDIATSPTTAAFASIEINVDGNVRVVSWTNYTTLGTSRYSITRGSPGEPLFARIRKVSADYSFDISMGGLSFARAWTTSSLGFTPAYMVIAVNSEASGTPVANFDFYRQSSDTSRDAPVVGRTF